MSDTKSKTKERHDNDQWLSIVSRSIRDIIFGLEDGVVSTLGAITGIAGATLDSKIVILSGLVLITVEALSMAAGTYLSAKSEREVQEKIIADELKAIREHPKQEKQELVDMYRERGFSNDEINVCVGRIMKDEKLILEEMMHKELGIVHDALHVPVKNAVWMWVSYMVGGFIPLTFYFFLSVTIALPVSLIVTVMALFLIGAIKSKITLESWLRSGLEMLIISSAAAGVGYLVGRLVELYIF